MHEIAKHIIALLLNHKRQVKIYAKDCQGNYCVNCQEPHLFKVIQALKVQQPLILILPAFPAKSANRQKTISAKPDLGEIMGLRNLNELCKEIEQLHPLGVKLIICSDGRVFNDLVLVDDEDVDIYQQGIQAIITHNQLTHLSTFSLDDIYPHQDYERMREQLINQFGESVLSIKKRIQLDEMLLYQFNGIHRFITEDQLYLRTSMSKNQVRKEAKQIAYDVLRRSNAWSNLLAMNFPQAIRLSIHPQPCGSEKLGIQFLPAANCWATPWHNVLLKNRQCWQLVKRIEAERLGATLKQDHYVLEDYA
ncbi:pyoverdine biosynthesis protein PvcA [Legionella beliardensis]|uniref:Pyoverdine biosynthesis protein PvcA n=1 Tax=Legionella beliardensis TaxID=91822 RepID=A0A378HYA4_9GAMM|nr:isocyanide synthase family protein [Legionella beliardensis]STX27869.1 pyoverdine biosynthesis protein PvcA [Legionella beliardensis]